MENTPDGSEPVNRVNGPPPGQKPVKVDMGAGPGIVQILFDPPASRLAFNPKTARDFAIAILNNVQIAELPPPPLIQQFDPGPIIPVR